MPKNAFFTLQMYLIVDYTMLYFILFNYIFFKICRIVNTMVPNRKITFKYNKPCME